MNPEEIVDITLTAINMVETLIRMQADPPEEREQHINAVDHLLRELAARRGMMLLRGQYSAAPGEDGVTDLEHKVFDFCNFGLPDGEAKKLMADLWARACLFEEAASALAVAADSLIYNNFNDEEVAEMQNIINRFNMMGPL